MWFYHHKIINFIYPFALEQLNLGEMLTENMIINYKVTNTKKFKIRYNLLLEKCDQTFKMT